jgi:hypothetical protein
MDAPADPVAGFEAKRVAAGAIQLAEGGQAGGSGSDYDYVDVVRRHGSVFVVFRMAILRNKANFD